jgi:hypothetical protein
MPSVFNYSNSTNRLVLTFSDSASFVGTFVGIFGFGRFLAVSKVPTPPKKYQQLALILCKQNDLQVSIPKETSLRAPHSRRTG